MGHRIDTPDAGPSSTFTEGDPGLNIVATEVDGDWLTNRQENEVRTVERAGLTPLKGTLAAPAGFEQLADAVEILAGRAASNGLANLCINPGFDLWQASKVSPPSFDMGDARPDGHQGYTADQWFARLGTVGLPGRGTITRVAISPGTGATARAGGFALQWQQIIGGSGGLQPYLETRLEGLEHLDGQKLTVSLSAFVASGSTDFVPYIRQNFGTGGSGDVEVTASAWTFDGTNKRWKVTFDVPSIAGKTVGAGNYLAVGIKAPTGTTFTVTLSAVVINFGQTPIDFAPIPGPLLLALCQRYYWKTWEPDTPIYTVTTIGAVPCEEAGNAQAALNIRFPVAMRTIPAITWVAPNDGLTGRIERPLGTSNLVGSTSQTSSRQTGMPSTPSTTAVDSRAHAIADARL